MMSKNEMVEEPETRTDVTRISQPDDKFVVRWVDSGREALCGANPNFLEGRDFDVSQGAERACVLDLPYPAPRVGHYIIECKVCRQQIGFLTSGLPSDPRRVKFACKPRLN